MHNFDFNMNYFLFHFEFQFIKYKIKTGKIEEMLNTLTQNQSFYLKS